MADVYERKGTLFLRGDHMNYSRAVQTGNWHQAREAEPKDYDLNKNSERNLCRSTYDRIATVTDGSFPTTTYTDLTNQVKLKPEFTEQEARKPMIVQETQHHVNLDRETDAPAEGYGAVLPSHHPEHKKMHLQTTYIRDYSAPVEFTSLPMEEAPDYSVAYKKCLSQFADTANHRRVGRNTWQDESGVHHNSHHKRNCPTLQSRDLREFMN